jgi:hypothetical protein
MNFINYEKQILLQKLQSRGWRMSLNLVYPLNILVKIFSMEASSVCI